MLRTEAMLPTGTREQRINRAALRFAVVAAVAAIGGAVLAAPASAAPGRGANGQAAAVNGQAAVNDQAVADYKAAHDTDPHSPLPADRAKYLQDKQNLAQQHVTSKARGAQDGVSTMAAGGGINIVQQPQQTSYWCGPATVTELLTWKGVSITQSQAATLLKTTTDGTAWSGVNISVPSPTGYPVADAMNYKVGVGYYVPTAVAGSPSSADIATYQNDLVYDIDHAWGLAGDAWEVPTGSHLTGHPTDRTIFHWYAIFGYDNSGTGTDYADSVHGATSISWSGNVPAYTINFSSSTITHINGGRGYIW